MSSHDTALPKAVRDQIAHADKLYDEVYGETKPEQTEEPTNEPASTPPEQSAEREQAQTPKEPANEDTWEHKFKVLKGKYDKEVPRLHRQLRESQDRENTLQDRLTQLEVTVRGLQSRKPEPEQPQPEALSQEEIDQFGPDLIDIIRRVAKAETGVVLDNKLKPVQQKMEQVNESVAKTSETVANSARQRMLNDLATAVPNWAEQNEDEDFLDWLDEKDPYSGKVRKELLADAYRSNDGERLIALFQGFQKENAVVDPSDQQPTDSGKEAPAKEKPGSESPDGLDELVAPGTPKTGSTGAQNESGKKIWSQREVQDFYARKNEFIKKNPERELPENIILQERDIFKAQHEGRIRG